MKTMTAEKIVGMMDRDLEKVTPGQTIRMEALGKGDVVWQGDLGFEVVAETPEDGAAHIAMMCEQSHEVVGRVSIADRQLVPGNTQGAKHCLSSSNVKMCRPKGWGKPDTDDSLDGPVFTAVEEVTVMHPTHGSVVIPAGMTVRCGYQRELDAETRRERRNAD